MKTAIATLVLSVLITRANAALTPVQDDPGQRSWNQSLIAFSGPRDVPFADSCQPVRGQTITQEQFDQQYKPSTLEAFHVPPQTTHHVQWNLDGNEIGLSMYFNWDCLLVIEIGDATDTYWAPYFNAGFRRMSNHLQSMASGWSLSQDASIPPAKIIAQKGNERRSTDTDTLWKERVKAAMPIQLGGKSVRVLYGVEGPSNEEEHSDVGELFILRGGSEKELALYGPLSPDGMESTIGLYDLTAFGLPKVAVQYVESGATLSVFRAVQAPRSEHHVPKILPPDFRNLQFE